MEKNVAKLMATKTNTGNRSIQSIANTPTFFIPRLRSCHCEEPQRRGNLPNRFPRRRSFRARFLPRSE